MEEFDLIIVGAGLAGSALAAALRTANKRLALVETRPPAAPGEAWDARIYAVSPANARLLGDIGVWGHIDAARLTPVHAMEIFGDNGGRLTFSAFDAGVGELAWIAESGRLQWELWQNLRRQPNLTLFCPASPAALRVDETRVRLELEDGRLLEARLIVGADGVESWVRGQGGIGARIGSYGERGVVVNLRAQEPHRQTAFQWFRDDGVLAWLPLAAHEVSIVWSTPSEQAELLCALEPAELCRRIENAGEARLGHMEPLTRALSFPLRIMRVESMVAPRLALIGDAAHAIHPLSGHGVNLGFQDAAALARVLLDAPPRADIGEIRLLRRFERSRAEEILALQALTHGLQRLFNARNAPLTWLRNVGLNLTDRAGVVRNALARYAMG